MGDSTQCVFQNGLVEVKFTAQEEKHTKNCLEYVMTEIYS